MERIDYKTMLDIARWHHNHHPSEGLTSGLFTETFGEDLGRHFHGKWTAYFNGNLWDMLAYFDGAEVLRHAASAGVAVQKEQARICMEKTMRHRQEHY